jgi:hypothetical protein
LVEYIPAKERGAVLHPHVVILGAGASLAAVPNGDANGNKPPLLWNLAHILGFADEVKRLGLDEFVDDFEALYSHIQNKPEFAELTSFAEQRINSYFGALQLPSEPTVYDYLILGLRKKDLIATFNWDPFLIQAYRRNHAAVKGRLPNLCFLHGNVLAGVCHDDKIKGIPGAPCSKCGKPFQATKLLFPVDQKDYNSDLFVKLEWDAAQHYSNLAYIFTVFGYSAPKTDVEARSLLKSAWTSSRVRSQSELEIIDVKSEQVLDEAWEEFQFSHHYRYHTSFSESLIGQRPRRSCELLFSWLLDVQWTETKPYPEFKTLDALHDWITPLIEEEEAHENGAEMLL